ncbi:MAG: RnfABCDGE type electron transport complex subunit D [Candidatus Omnitrophica bacterium]|nr:RnfABCDGE type electron transport complex subunit D [Candidatus Omnitrophota bacterium]
MKNISIKSQLIIYLALFASYLSIIDKNVSFLLAVLFATVSAAAVDSAFTYITSKKLLVTESSIISGLIIGYVLASDNRWWVFIAAAFIAIGSKHFIRFKGKHLFNPAAIGIFLSMVLLQAQTQWKGTYVWYIVVPFGLYFVWKIRKLEVLYNYAVSSLVLFGIQAFTQHVPPANIFGYFSYFYIFVMLIEPKTTPIKPLTKTIFGIGVAALIFALTQAGVTFDVELASLLVLNMCVPVLNKIPEVKR